MDKVPSEKNTKQQAGLRSKFSGRVGYVLIISETALGRMTGKSPAGAFRAFGNIANVLGFITL